MLKSASGETLMICGYLGNSVPAGGTYVATGDYIRNGDDTFRATALSLNMGSHSGNVTVSLRVGNEVGSSIINGNVKNMSDLTIRSPFTMTPGNTYNVSGTITLTD